MSTTNLREFSDSSSQLSPVESTSTTGAATTQLTLSDYDAQNFSVTAADGVVLYVVYTAQDEAFPSNPTYVSRPRRTSQPSNRTKLDIVAKLQYGDDGQGIVEYNGEMSSLQAFLPSKTWPRSRIMYTPHGEWKWTAKWSIGGYRPILYNSNRVAIVTCSRHPSLFKSNPPTLTIAMDAMQYLDRIIIGYIVSLRDHKMLTEEY
ncbi:hypothetical protein BS47DRAFT_1360828 [Hydnum rufescens UP504]|uniref:DUF6593 domain-containing protein n=1 Tax=Hydnum rufescens UP504 TaxID=1448309 RepID=A0A9P6B136_9AGAM|nr:hypothetical protein BS47DRAFT_1360828 [Hydnum rufescens UP504]